MLTALINRGTEKPPSSEGGGPQGRGVYASEVAGFLIVDEYRGEAFVDDLAVFPKFHRRGIAAALMARAETAAILRGSEKIHLEVRESNAPARNLYEARGYKAVGRRKNFYENPTEDAILMTMEVK